MRRLLDLHGQRTASAALYWPSSEPELPEDSGPLGPDPTRRVGDHPEL